MQENATRKGKLQLFVGAAPGVGKTYTMLKHANALNARGVDVVIGYVDVHDRPETAQQIMDLEVVPPIIINYSDRSFTEVDVDSILVRKPGVVVIDELAHTNAPGSCRRKRYEDVECLLENGIDVLTAVNVQHLETVAKEAETVIGHRIREVVPASFLKRADEVEVVDVTPETLRQRLRDGSIYPKEKIEHALQNFFTKSNLSALRELALREVAQDVEDRLQKSFDRQKIPGPVGAKESIMVCVNYMGRAPKLMVKAARMAERMKADLIVLTIVSKDNDDMTKKDEERLQALRALADEHHGRVVIEFLNDRPLGAVIVESAQCHNATLVVIGQPSRVRKWVGITRHNPVHYLLCNLKYTDLRVVGWKE